MKSSPPEVRILANAAAAVPLLLDEVRTLLTSSKSPLLGFATGGTFTAFLQALGHELGAGRIPAAGNLLATHLDEYLGYAPDQKGGMVHELGSACPHLLAMLAKGTFFPVPHDDAPASLRAHEQRLQRAGGVQLQFLGIGRNGHLAFNEPGTPFDSGFHGTTLAETTREDARARFRPAEPPTRAVTSGIATILAAKRLVLCAFGKAKAPAVAAMLQGPVAPTCPASVVRTHGNVLVLLDREAASLLQSGLVGA
ncbi:MAG: glucosamine-6-phosphate deaminase [Planctomycetes bacterium]|nr:glucosamine-6-phosphate deaminase [Planctomycetota bacterium]